MRVRRHRGDAEIGIELGIVRGFELADTLAIVPDGWRDLDQVGVFLLRQDVEREAQARGSDSRPGSGLLSILTTGGNQDGKPVISFVSTTFVDRLPVKP